MSSMKYEEMKSKIENIVNQPIKKFKQEEIKGIIERYHKNHPKSKEAYKRARKIIPGGIEHNLAFNHPFPLASKSVYDCYMKTVDDVVLTDFLMCGGPIILGHQYKPLINKVVEVIDWLLYPFWWLTGLTSKQVEKEFKDAKRYARNLKEREYQQFKEFMDRYKEERLNNE